MKKARLVIMVGASGSGKSTLAQKVKEQAKENFGIDAHIISLDVLREEYLGDRNDMSREKMIVDIADQQINMLLRSGCCVIYDATNLKKVYRRKMVEIGRSHNAEIAYCVVERSLESKLETGEHRLDVIFPDGQNLVENHHKRWLGARKDVIECDGFEDVELIHATY